MTDMTQVAPYPEELKALVDGLTYRPGWRFFLAHIDRGQGSVGLTLVIQADVVNSYNPDEPKVISHYAIVPAAAYDVRSWRRWLFDQLVLVETHEAMEFFTIDGAKPYAPSHGPGNDPYIVREVGTELDQKTSFRGTVNE